MIYNGVVESIFDPLECGRVKVRIFGLHTDDKNLIPTEDLPWAQVLKPTDSASISGIGTSGSGMVQGSWVVVDFLDEDKQYPIVMGTIPGIPRDPFSLNATNEQQTVFSGDRPASILADSNGSPVVSSDGSGVTTAEQNKELVAPVDGARRATNFTTVSDRCISLIKESEGFKATAYPDLATSTGRYAIGYGSWYYKDGRQVKAGDTITQAEALDLMKAKINQEFLPGVKKAITVPVTQSMIDALVDFAYTLSVSKFAKSTLVSELNSGRYGVAASKFIDYNKAKTNDGFVELPGLTIRRKKEQKLFLADGIPDSTGEIDQSSIQPDNEYNSSGNAEQPINANQKLKNFGFTDPSGKYPLYRNEPDSHRLARHQNIEKTIVYKKESGRKTGIPVAGGGTFDQPEIPYNTQYPFNKVMATESGHVMEFDDTENSRRVHLYHAAGTFIEIDDNGTQVNRIVGDGFEILERNGYVFVNGALNVTVNGSTNLKVGNTLNIDVDGACNINVYNDVNLRVSGDLNTHVDGNINTNVSGSYGLNVAGDFALNASNISFPSGYFGLDIGSAGGIATPEDISFSPLTVITRGVETAVHYETPEEGDPTAFNNARIARGEITKEELTSTGNKKESSQAPTPNKNTVLADCGAEIHNMTEFPADFKLSKYFTIGSMTKNNTRPIIPQMGLTKDQIACNMKMLAVNCMDTIRDMYPNMIITSGFRRPGDVPASSANSRHYYGEAVDIQLPGTNREGVYNAIKKIAGSIDYDQLILEYQGSSTVWIHVSYKKGTNRRQAFTMNNHSRCSNFGEFVLI
jgi:GH24 family phage-related lysozyme (muramidase)